MRRWRWPVAVVVFLGFLALFFVGSPLPLHGILGRQIADSWLYFVPALVVIVLFMALAALFGRLYCSVLCPFGTAQEVAHRIGGRKTRPSVRHVVNSVAMLLPWIAAFLGFAAVFDYFSPLAWFGRMAEPILSPLRRYLLGQTTFLSTWGAAEILAMAVLLALLVVSVIWGRLFCDRICPVGAVLGLMSALSPWRMRFDRDACTSCGKCSSVCPVRCLDGKTQTLDASRCVLCFKCADACSRQAIRYGLDDQVGKRRTLGRLLAGVGALALLRLGYDKVAAADPTPRLMPPGAGDAATFNSSCISCQACVAACPVGILRPGFPSYRPEMDYSRHYCQYECTVCMVACPARALALLSLEEKKRTRIGKTQYRRSECVIIKKGTACGACAEVCPTHAVEMKVKDGLLQPDFDPEYCIGCGACQFACPAEPKAFLVSGVEKQEKTPGVRPASSSRPEAPPEGDVDGFPF